MDRIIKKKVTEEWLNIFSQLSAFNQNKLYKVVGPCIIGIELIKTPFKENYSPYFVIYPLWKQDVKTCLDYPILLMEFKDKKGFQYDIPYENHEVFFDDVLTNVKKQIPLSLESDVSFKKIMSVLEEYSKTPPLSAAPNSYLQATLQEAKLKIALSIDISEAQKILQQISKRSWDVNHFKACGVNVSKWLQNLHEEISNRENFLKQIETNKKEKKMLQLVSSELTI